MAFLLLNQQAWSQYEIFTTFCYHFFVQVLCTYSDRILQQSSWRPQFKDRTEATYIRTVLVGGRTNYENLVTPLFCFPSCPLLLYTFLPALNFPHVFPFYPLITTNNYLHLCLIQTLCLRSSGSTLLRKILIVNNYLRSYYFQPEPYLPEGCKMCEDCNYPSGAREGKQV